MRKTAIAEKIFDINSGGNSIKKSNLIDDGIGILLKDTNARNNSSSVDKRS
jgi:hypothetical protein